MENGICTRIYSLGIPCCTIMWPKSSLSSPSPLSVLASSHGYLLGNGEQSPLYPRRKTCKRKEKPTFPECFQQWQKGGHRELQARA